MKDLLVNDHQRKFYSLQKYLIVYILIFFIQLCVNAQEPVVRYVDPFIGTKGRGNTFPGAVAPWGMISFSPHNSSAPSGYEAGQKYISGFGLLHLNGASYSALGNLSILPIRSKDELLSAPKVNYFNESASPGYYGVTLLPDNVKVEAVALERSALIQLTSAQKEIYLRLDASTNLSGVTGGCINKLSDSVITGWSNLGKIDGFRSKRKVYFCLKTSVPMRDFYIVTEGKKFRSDSFESLQKSFHAILVLPTEKSLVLRVGISFVSVKNALLNLNTEVDMSELKDLRILTEKKWNDVLSRIILTTATTEQKKLFYTSLYHSLIHPSVFSDVNGEYPVSGSDSIGKAEGYTRFTVFPLFYTYRTLHPLLTLVYPEIQTDILKTITAIYKESGWLPKWEMFGEEHWKMIGDPAPIVIGDSYKKGLESFDAGLAYQGMLKGAELTADSISPIIRPGLKELFDFQYLPVEPPVQFPFTTMLEYNLSDWAIANITLRFESQITFKRYLFRSKAFKNLYDSRRYGLFPKNKDGTFAEINKKYFFSGNRKNEMFFIPQDIEALLGLMEDTMKFYQQLKMFFKENNFSFASPHNLGYPLLFNYTPNKYHESGETIHSLLTGNFKAIKDGYPAEAQYGMLSSWVVFAGIGIYPLATGKDVYQLARPQFGDYYINIGKLNSPQNRFYVKVSNKKFKEVLLNGKKLDSVTLWHREIKPGTILEFR